MTTCLPTRCARGAARLVPCGSLRVRGASGRAVLSVCPFVCYLSPSRLSSLQPIFRQHREYAAQQEFTIDPSAARTTVPGSGYVQNPISVYYCYNTQAQKNANKETKDEKGEKDEKDEMERQKKKDEIAVGSPSDSRAAASASSSLCGPQTLAVCVAEVTNTPWGERVVFNFDPAGQRVPKALHVSPFMDMRGGELKPTSRVSTPRNSRP